MLIPKISPLYSNMRTGPKMPISDRVWSFIYNVLNQILQSSVTPSATRLKLSMFLIPMFDKSLLILF